VTFNKKGYSMQAFDVVTYGEAMAMFVADETGDLSTVNHFTRRLAGAETNVAIGLSRLGLRVGWVSRTGTDAFGRYVRAQVASEGVDCSQVRIDPRFPTGFQLKSKAENGEDPLTEYFRKGSAASHLSLDGDFDADYFLAARHLHATGVAAALSDSSNAFAHHAIDFMRANGKTVSFDPNLRPTLWPSEQVMVEQINRLAVKADWVLPGLTEGKILTGYSRPEEIAAFYLDQGVDKVIVKLGPDGAYFHTAAGEIGVVAAVPVATVIDTVGAGDGFAAGVISALLEGLPLEQAVVRGNHIGAFAIQVVGDMEGFPTRAQLDAAIQAS
jgi:2-dehydro-3-deoxygluconokinase